VRAAVFCTNALYVPLILNVRSTRRPYTVSVPRVLHVHRTSSPDFLCDVMFTHFYQVLLLALRGYYPFEFLVPAARPAVCAEAPWVRISTFHIFTLAYARFAIWGREICETRRRTGPIGTDESTSHGSACRMCRGRRAPALD
jgi:hypothetical protein